MGWTGTFRFIFSVEKSMQENIVEELQRLFVHMQVSPRDRLSPDSLVRLLGVNENEQQVYMFCFNILSCDFWLIPYFDCSFAL